MPVEMVLRGGGGGAAVQLRVSSGFIPVSLGLFPVGLRRAAARRPPATLAQFRRVLGLLSFPGFPSAPGWRLSCGSSNKGLLRRGRGEGMPPPSLSACGGGGRRFGDSIPDPVRCLLALQPAPAHGVWRRSDSSAGEAPWWGVSVADEVGGSSLNKCVAAPVSGGLLLLFLLLAGHGGEGQRKRNRGAWGSDDRRGICSFPASRRDAGRFPLLCFGKLPRWKLLEHLELGVPIRLERCCPPDNSCAPPVTFSAGLGGEGEGVGGRGHVLLRGWIYGFAAGAALMDFGCIGFLPLPASSEDQQLPRVTVTSDANLADPCRCPSSAAPRKESSSYTADFLRIAMQVVFVFWPLGCIRQRQLRSSLMSLPRFSGEDHSVLSSVMLTLYLQLNLRPCWSLPSRLPVEPLALRMERLLEAPEVHSCRFISSVFSTDPLAGSDCVLPRRRLVFLAVFITSVGAGSSFTSNHLSSLCMSLFVFC